MSNDTLQFKKLLKYPHIVHGISTKEFGSMKNDGTVDSDNLGKFTKSLGMSGNAVCMQQIHSGNVSVIKKNDVLRIPETDSLATDKKQIPLAVLTADCLPIMFYDSKKEVIALAHAGYRGLLQHIIENTVERLVSEFKTDPHDVIVGIGPSIETMCYEVGDEVIEKFEKEFPELEDMYTSKDNKFYLSLGHTAKQILMQKGILEKNIESIDICTKCDDRFYSYRGGDGDKRFASVLSLI